MESQKIAFFDCDGTLTREDSMIGFIKYLVGIPSFYLGLTAISPVMFIFLLGLIKNDRAKQSMTTWFFKGRDSETFFKRANLYSTTMITPILRPGALDRIKWHKAQGHRVVMVSASMECWLKGFCDQTGIELIATKLEVLDGKLTGKMATKNCHGQEKVNRIKELVNLSDYDYIYAYGDTSGDKEMLELSDEPSFKPFR